MKSICRFSPVLVVPLTAALAGADRAERPDAPERLARLVRQLGDESFTTREAAGKELEAVGEPALPALHRAAASAPDLEARRRAERVIRAIGNPLPPGAVRRLGTRRFRGDFVALALAPDGKTFVTNGGNDYEGTPPAALVWDAATGRRLQALTAPDHARAGGDLHFSRDGKRLLGLGAPAYGAYLFEMPAGKFLRLLHQDSLEYAVALAPGAREVAVLEVVSRGPPTRYGIRIRPVEGGASRPLPGKDFTGGSDDYAVIQNRVVAYSPSGSRLATWGAKGQPVRVYDLKAGRHLFDLEGHRGRVEVCVFSPDESALASAGTDRTVRLWDLKTGKERMRLGHPAGVFDAAFSPDGRSLVTASGWWWVGGHHQAEGVRSWDAATGKERWCHPGYARRVAVSPDGKRVFAVGKDSILVLDARTGKPLHPPGHEGAVQSVAFSPDGKELVSSGGWGGQVCVWCPHNGRLLREYRGEAAAVSFQTCRGSDGKLVSFDLVGQGEGRVTLSLRDLATGRALHRLGPFGLEGAHRGGTWFPWERRPGAWELKRARSDRAKDFVRTVVLSPDGKTVAVCPVDRPLRLLDVRSGKELRRFGDEEEGWAAEAVFSPDGKVLATFNSEARLWDVATGRQLRGWKLPAGGYNLAVAFSPCGRFLAVGADNGAIHVFGAWTGKELRRFQGPTRERVHPNYVRALAFSPDGKLLASGHWDTTVLLWDVTGLKTR